MKGIVVDINKNKMIIMKKDGSFIKERLIKEAEIGQEVSISEPTKIYNNLYKYSLIAATFMLFIFGGLQAKAYYTPYGYLNIDINPSIEVSYNKFERVLGVKGLNDDGSKVISNTENLINDKLEDAVACLVKTANADNYLVEKEDNQILLSTYSPDNEESNEVKDKVNKSVLNYLSSQSKKAEVLNEIVTKADLDMAATQKISVGKLKLYQRAKEVDSSITLADVANKPVRDTVKLIKEKKQEQEKKNNSNTKDDTKSEELIKPVLPTAPKSDNVNEDNGTTNYKGEKENTGNINKVNKSNDQTDKIIKQKFNQIPKIESQLKAKDKIETIKQRMKDINNKDKNAD